MRICTECGKRCRKKFRIKQRYNGKNRYHKLLNLNEDYIAVKLIILCEECLGWNKGNRFCCRCLDINPMCGFYRMEKYVGICNDCSGGEAIGFELDLFIGGYISRYHTCDQCMRICNENITTKESIKDKNRLHAIRLLRPIENKHLLFICQRCYKWEERTNIYCNICTGTNKETTFIDDTIYPSVCIECSESLRYAESLR